MAGSAGSAGSGLWDSRACALPHKCVQVKLTTLTNNYATLFEGKLMLRLAHLYAVDEHPTLSKPATISLAAVFAKTGESISHVLANAAVRRPGLRVKGSGFARQRHARSQARFFFSVYNWFVVVRPQNYLCRGDVAYWQHAPRGNGLRETRVASIGTCLPAYATFVLGPAPLLPGAVCGPTGALCV